LPFYDVGKPGPVFSSWRAVEEADIHY
jgi:hypothetical protein